MLVVIDNILSAAKAAHLCTALKPGADSADKDTLVRLSGLYHNLMRRWTHT